MHILINCPLYNISWPSLPGDRSSSSSYWSSWSSVKDRMGSASFSGFLLLLRLMTGCWINGIRGFVGSVGSDPDPSKLIAGPTETSRLARQCPETDHQVFINLSYWNSIIAQMKWTRLLTKSTLQPLRRSNNPIQHCLSLPSRAKALSLVIQVCQL